MEENVDVNLKLDGMQDKVDENQGKGELVDNGDV